MNMATLNSQNASRLHSLRVSAVVEESHDAKSLILDMPEALAETFQYRPGQFLTLRLPMGDRTLMRCYSMSSAPGLDAALRVTIKRVNNGQGSNWICDELQPGSQLEVLPPAGVFTPRSLEGDFILMAGGSGITPVFSILRSVLAHGRGRISLFYANRDERSVIFRAELEQLAAAHPKRLQALHWLDSVQGLPSVAQLSEWARPHATAQAFVCGPAAFMDASLAALRAVGVQAGRMHAERFVSLPDEDAAPSAEAAPAQPAVSEAEFLLRLDGEEHTLRCGGNETLLEAAMRIGIIVPNSCRAGLCASCMCKVTDGAVHLRHNEALEQRDLDLGWTLACQAVPASARVCIEFPE